jgi:amino-acid N-acetyltransferase
MIRKAKISEAQVIHHLINEYAAENLMLPISLSQVYEHIRDYFVAEENGKVIGCCGLKIAWEDLAEIRSLAVSKEALKKGYGKSLVQKALEEAVTLGVKKVFCLTTNPQFFEKLGFKIIDKSQLPQKIWADCIACSKFPHCDEVALILKVSNQTQNP